MSDETHERFASAARLVSEHRDVVDARVWDGRPPAALERRGWVEVLLALDDDALATLETEGLGAPWPADAPRSLVTLFERAREVATLAPLVEDDAPRGRLRRGETPRKRAQIEAFARLSGPVAARASRVLDVGSGHGHLTRLVASDLGREVVGLERDATLASRARALSRDDGVSFTETDVLEDGLDLADDDCVLGLHACGELGDVMVEAAARSGASIALVGCCLQKRRSPARALLASASHLGGVAREAVTLPREVLGLSNLVAREVGVERTRGENLAARERRFALHRLLAARGLATEHGAELRGLNRRAGHLPLDALVTRAFAARALDPPSADEIAEAAAWASREHARARRLSLPRALLARPIEILVLCDRALALSDAGFVTKIGTAFPSDVSARNLALVASRGARAPRPNPHEV